MYNSDMAGLLKTLVTGETVDIDGAFTTGGVQHLPLVLVRGSDYVLSHKDGRWERVSREVADQTIAQILAAHRAGQCMCARNGRCAEET